MNIPQQVEIEQEYDPTDEFIAQMEDVENQAERQLEEIADRGFESEVL